MSITETFRHWLQSEPGPWRIGQVRIRSLPERSGFYSLSHADDVQSDNLQISADRFRLRHWVRQDEDGKFRPLKAEGNLPRGWRIEPLDIAELKEALDIVYPTALANWVEREEWKLRVTSFAETAGRQTGMYRITASTSDAQREQVTDELCRARCLKQRLWNGENTPASPREIPLLCPEVCNLFVASCRAKIKGKVEEE
jgi:hypothetical protein